MRFTGDVETAATLKREALEVARADPDAVVHDRAIGRWTAALLSDLSHMELDAGRLGEAHVYADEALALRRQRGDPAGIAHALGATAMIAYAERDFGRARDLLAEARAGWEAAGRHEEAGMASLGIAECEVLLEQCDGVGPRLRQAIEILQVEHDVFNAVHVLRVAAMLAASHGDAAWSATMFGLADRREAETGMSAFSRAENEVRSDYRERVRATLGEAGFRAAYERGAEMPDKRSFDLALEYVATEGAEGAHPARLPTTRGAP